MQIVLKPLSDLIPYAKNSRKHSKGQVDQLVKSLQEYGWTNPVLVNGAATIIAGHGRVMAAQKIARSGGSIPRWPDVQVAPTIELSGLTEAQARAYVIADNQSALGASWDKDLLALEVQALKSMNFNMEALCFKPDALIGFMGQTVKPGLTDPDALPAVVAGIVSEPGNVWRLGAHRLICGDSTSSEAVARVLGGAQPQLMVTDPPYGVEYDASWRQDAGLTASAQTGKVANDERESWASAFRLFTGAVAYVWHAGRYASAVQRSLEVVGFEIRSQIIWVKKRFAISRGHYHWRHEPCWYAVRKGQTGGFVGGRKQNTVWADIVDKRVQPDTFAAAIDEKTIVAFDGSATTVWELPHDRACGGGHSTQKPVECMRRPMENNSEPGDAVFEPFLGSGTTLIAAEQSGRICYACEIQPNYVDVAVRRWQAFTGLAATLEADGRTFVEIEAARSPALPVHQEVSHGTARTGTKA